MRRIFAVAWLLASIGGSAQAQAQTSLGAGGTLCSQYTKAARSSDILYHQASNWLLGYVGGMAEAFKSPVAGLSGDQLLGAAAAYCEANPGSTVANAAHQWFATASREAAPKQAEAPKDGGDWVRLNLTAPTRKPLLDRR